MSTIISPADFTVDNEMPNKSLQGNDIQAHIDKREPEYLEAIMGESLYSAYVANPTESRFTTLIAQTYFKPAIVDYVYWFYLNAKNAPQFNTGAGQAKQKNAERVSQYPSMVAAWNEMVGYNKKINKYLKADPTLYPEYVSVNMPTWYFWNDRYLIFNWGWYSNYGWNQLPEIYRIKNSLGI